MKNILALTMILALSMFCMMGCSSESASKNDEIPTVTVAQEETSKTIKSAEKTVTVSSLALHTLQMMLILS